MTTDLQPGDRIQVSLTRGWVPATFLGLQTPDGDDWDHFVKTEGRTGGEFVVPRSWLRKVPA